MKLITRKPAKTWLTDLFNADALGRDFLDTDDLVGTPPVNIREDEMAYFIEVAVPGMERKDFDIRIDGNLMTVSAEHRLEETREEKGYTLREFGYRSFSRSFTLPDFIDQESIKANYNKGVLELVVPKVPEPEQALGRQIEVE